MPRRKPSSCQTLMDKINRIDFSKLDPELKNSLRQVFTSMLSTVNRMIDDLGEIKEQLTIQDQQSN